MPEHVINWFVDTLARTETLDLFFVITNLIDYPETPIQQFEGAYYDSMGEATARTAYIDDRRHVIVNGVDDGAYWKMGWKSAKKQKEVCQELQTNYLV